MTDRITHDNLRDLTDEVLVSRLVAHMDAEAAELAAEGDTGDCYAHPFSMAEAADAAFGMGAPPPCDCEPGVPGAFWPCASDCDDSAAWVERCDSCQRIRWDADAARAVSRATGWPIRWALLHGDREWRREYAYVQPAHLGIRPGWREGHLMPYPRSAGTYYDHTKGVPA